MEYYLFIDESGDHGLQTIDDGFPVFTLCGILISQDEYEKFSTKLKILKRIFWGKSKVLFHSRDIRKMDKEFQILFDAEVKAKFYKHLNNIISEIKFEIISTVVNKNKYIEKYGKTSKNVYEISLSYIIERTVFCMDHRKNETNKVWILIEKRGRNEDASLSKYLQIILSLGTYYVDRIRINATFNGFRFFDKNDDIPGLQLADLTAYPISRYAIDRERANPAFDLLKEKFYQRGNRMYGLKIYP